MTLRLLLLAPLAVLIASPALAGPPTPAHAPTLEWGPNRIDSGDSAELTVEERRGLQQRLRVRRTLMETHQVFAFVTAGSLIAAEVVGLINDISLENGDPTRAELEGSLAAHRILAGVALTGYLGAGITAWAAPRALRLNTDPGAKKKFDSGDLHVLFSVIHGIAMATVIATGFLQANVVAANKGWDGLIIAHEIAAFTASGFVIAAGITIGTL